MNTGGYIFLWVIVFGLVAFAIVTITNNNSTSTSSGTTTISDQPPYNTTQDTTPDTAQTDANQNLPQDHTDQTTTPDSAPTNIAQDTTEGIVIDSTTNEGQINAIDEEKDHQIARETTDQTDTTNSSEDVTESEQQPSATDSESVSVSTDLSNNVYRKEVITYFTSACVSIAATSSDHGIVSGSGFFCSIRDTIYISTAAHVVQGISSICAYYTNVLSESRIVPVHVVGIDEVADVALLRCEWDNDDWKLVTPLQFKTSIIGIGDDVLLMGNPYGMDHMSPSTGIVKDNDYTDTAHIMDTHAICIQCGSVIPGNSGSAIIDSSKKVVGIVSYGIKSYSTIAFGASGQTMSRIFESIHDTQSDYGGKVIQGIDLGPVSNSLLLHLAQNIHSLPIIRDDGKQLFVDMSNTNVGYYIDNKSSIYTSDKTLVSALRVNLVNGQIRLVYLSLVRIELTQEQRLLRLKGKDQYDQLVYVR